jgi:hypothetical protein
MKRTYWTREENAALASLWDGDSKGLNPLRVYADALNRRFHRLKKIRTADSVGRNPNSCGMKDVSYGIDRRAIR